MRIIPAIDIMEGQCVRLSQGNYGTKKIYSEDPLEVAKKFESHGIQYLHLVDLDGARSRHIVNYKVLEKIASRTTLQIDFGGGIKSEKDLQIAFDSGAQQITGGSIAVREPERFASWLSRYGNSRIILGADAKDRMVAVNGWEEDSEIEVVELINQFMNNGGKYVICTDISRDGMLKGSAEDLYAEILRQDIPPALIASGGVSNLEDVEALSALGCEGVIIGKALYEDRIALTDLEKFII